MQNPFTDQAIQYIFPDIKCPRIQTNPKPSTKTGGSTGFTRHLLYGWSTFRALLFLKEITFFQLFYRPFQTIYLIIPAQVEHHKNNCSEIIKLNLDCSFSTNLQICNTSFIIRSKAPQTEKTAKDACIPPKIISLLNQMSNNDVFLVEWGEGKVGTALESLLYLNAIIQLNQCVTKV